MKETESSLLDLIFLDKGGGIFVERSNTELVVAALKTILPCRKTDTCFTARLWSNYLGYSETNKPEYPDDGDYFALRLCPDHGKFLRDIGFIGNSMRRFYG
jgi:hypothetical protein